MMHIFLDSCKPLFISSIMNNYQVIFQIYIYLHYFSKQLLFQNKNLKIHTLGGGGGGKIYIYIYLGVYFRQCSGMWLYIRNSMSITYEIYEYQYFWPTHDRCIYLDTFLHDNSGFSLVRCGLFRLNENSYPHAYTHTQAQVLVYFRTSLFKLRRNATIGNITSVKVNQK